MNLREARSLGGPAVLGAVLLAGMTMNRIQIAAAAEAEPAVAAKPADKSNYTLFNSTPDSLLREMDTDRPNQTNSPHTVDAGHLQAEAGVAGYTYYRDRYRGANARFESWALGQVNFRLGLLQSLEANIIVNPYLLQKNEDLFRHRSTRGDGFGDTVAGFKLNLWGDDGTDAPWATALALQPQFKLPTSGSGVGNGHFEFFGQIPFLMNLPAGFHLGLQTVVSLERNLDNSGSVTGWANSGSIDHLIAYNIDMYVEYASHVTTERHQEAQQTLDVGVSYPLTDRVILDTGVNIGLNRASKDIQWLVGISTRF